MKFNATGPRNTGTSHPPLAHDAQGNPIAMPDGAAAWMLKRQTNGRPKVVLGPDRRPVRLPLDTTDEEILDNYGPATYRLDAIDALGNLLDHVTTIVIGDGEETEDEGEQRTWRSSRSAGSDLRFALETITQMARAQANALESVAEAQADWVKGLANARLLPRNAVYAPPVQAQLPAPVDHDNEADEEDEYDDADGSEGTSALASYAAIAQAAHGIVEKIPAAVQHAASAIAAARASMKTGAPSDAVDQSADPASPSAQSNTTEPNPMVQLSEINARLSVAERRVLREMLRGDNVDVLTRELLSRTVVDAVAWFREGIAVARGERAEAPAPPSQPATTSDADVMERVSAVAMLLSPEERAELMALLPRLAPNRLALLKAQLLAMSVEDAVGWIRANLQALKTGVAS